MKKDLNKKLRELRENKDFQKRFDAIWIRFEELCKFRDLMINAYKPNFPSGGVEYKPEPLDREYKIN